MKITKTFENATLRTVNNGFIELDCNGKTHCFHNASVISVNNGSISIEINWEPERGELVKITGTFIDAYCIIDKLDNQSIHCFGCKKIYYNGFCLKNISWSKSSETKISPVTPEEQQAFDDFCKSKGKIWNKEKLQWENHRWKPGQGTAYFHIIIAGGIAQTDDYIWMDDATDKNNYEMGNCFKTKKEADDKLKQIKKTLNSTI